MGTAGTKQAASYLSSGSSMSSGDTLVSQNGQFTLTIQPQPEPFPQVTLTANPTVVCWSPSMQLTGSLKPPAFQFSSSGVIEVMVEMLPGSPTPIPIANGNPKGVAGPFVMSMDNDGTVRVYQGTAPNSNYNKAIWPSPNGLLAGIQNSPAIAAFPTFTGGQGQLYAQLVQDFCIAWGPGTNVTDLRSQVYPYPKSYDPGNVFTIIQNQAANFPTPNPLPEGCSASDWTAVYDQIYYEVNYLKLLWQFLGGTDGFQTYVGDCGNSMKQGLGEAQSTLQDASNPPSFDTTLISIITGLFAVVGLVPAINAACTVLGAVVGILATIQGGDSLTGSMENMVQSLDTLVNNVNNESLSIYPTAPVQGRKPPISADWGKLQLYNTYQQQFVASISNDDFNTLQNQFEISVYQTIFPNWFAVVQATVTTVNNGVPGGTSTEGPMLVYAPVPNDSVTGPPWLAPSVLTDRLATLGVSMQDVFNGLMGWTLQSYNCTATVGSEPGGHAINQWICKLAK